MASLTEISIFTRKFAIWFVAAIIGYTILHFVVVFGINYWKAQNPVPIAPPDAAFGKLPSPIFSTVVNSTSGIQFALKTVSGQPPETTSAARIYKMPKKSPTLFSAERAHEFAGNLRFSDAPEELSTTMYRYTDSKDPRRSLQLDIITMNYHYYYDISQNPNEFIRPNSSLSKESVLTAVNEFINRNGLFSKEILEGEHVVLPLTYDSTRRDFSLARSFSDSTAARVYFFRRDINFLPVLPPSFDKSFNYALYASNGVEDKSIIELKYTYWPIDYTQYASYPLKSGTAAWQDILDGYGFVVSMGTNTSNTIDIRKIYLAYYDSEDPQLYLQPIFVFEGDNGFVAYLPAISPEWLE